MVKFAYFKKRPPIEGVSQRLRPRVRHFVYCVRIAFGHSQTRRPARFVLNADATSSLYSTRCHRA